MKITTCMGVAFLAGIFATTAVAETPRYDRKLEEAAMKIVAEKIGDIRTGFDVGETAVIIRPIESNAVREKPRYSLGGFEYSSFDDRRRN